MVLELSIRPGGSLVLRDGAPAERTPDVELPGSKQLAAAFAESPARGLLYLATNALEMKLPPSLEYARQFSRTYLTRLCHTPAQEAGSIEAIPPPGSGELATLLLQAPPLEGLEYLNADVLTDWWHDLDALVRDEIARHPGGAQAYLSEKNPLWRFVGRVTFHLAENKRDPQSPFAFLATYTSRLSAQGRAQHEPLGRALQQYAGDKNRDALLALLMPIQRAAERSALIKELVNSGNVYHPLAWSPQDAYRFLQDIPALEESGLIVRVPDWWKTGRPSRPVVSVKVDGRKGTAIDAAALLDFSVGMTLDGEPLSEAELQHLLESVGGLVSLKGKWVEVDRERLTAALQHWKEVERHADAGSLSFFEGMRLLAGAPLDRDAAADVPQSTREWTGLTGGAALEELLNSLRSPESLADVTPPGLQTELRPYQKKGVGWLRFLTRLGLGALLADDMGLGKTVQVIALLLDAQQEPGKAVTAERDQAESDQGQRGGGTPAPSLLVVPASLIGNWKGEIERFAPSLSFLIAHPSELPPEKDGVSLDDFSNRDLVITTYGMLTRLKALSEQTWRLVVLDEAQAIKNSGTRQSRAVKELRAAGRIALTGTPVENRLSDLWSLFDFLNPGLLGNAKAFSNFVKRMQAKSQPSYRPLRTLIQPYILRRLKTDKRVIADLPDKTEVRAFCSLSRQQAALYELAVRDLAEKLEQKGVEGIQRRGLVLSQLMRLKQICNHPAHWLGNEDYNPEHSGKFQRLAALCEEMAARQERVLVFTQFRELTGALANFLEGVFGRPGLVLHGGTSVPKRRELVQNFQRPDGPPFLVLSLKAGGTGLNLTEASQVIHFDRWWNPAVENQATDRAYRIGQKRNVLVHKFVCRGTLEERIDSMITEKSGLAEEILQGGEALLTEMNNEQLLSFVALDVRKALET